LQQKIDTILDDYQRTKDDLQQTLNLNLNLDNEVRSISDQL